MMPERILTSVTHSPISQVTHGQPGKLNLLSLDIANCFKLPRKEVFFLVF